MRGAPEWLPRRSLEVASGLVAALVAWAAVTQGRPVQLATAGGLALAVGAYVGLRHPLALYWGLAAVLGALPFAYTPGVHVPLYLAFAAAVVLAALVHPTAQTRVAPLELAVVALVLTSFLSLVATVQGSIDLLNFARWLISTSVVFALLRLSREDLARFGRIFVCAAAANAVFGMAGVALYPIRLIDALKPFGYGLEETARFVINQQGVASSVRLGGTWVDPNAAGLGLLIALAVCLVVFSGWQRVALSVVLVLGIALTLSRAAIFSLVAAALLVLVFHSMRTRDRRLAIGAIAAGVVVSAATPVVRHRVLTSFSSDDPASTARWDALVNYPGQLAGHWLFGLGWGRREYTDGAYAFRLNHVSNGPLFTVYRGGVITGLAFVLVFVVAGVVATRALRSIYFTHAMYGGIVLGFALVALQLDHPVVAVPSIVGTLSVLLAFLARLDPRLVLSGDPPTVPEVAARTGAAEPAVGGRAG